MSQHETIEIGSALWWRMLSGTTAIATVTILAGKNCPMAREAVRKISGWMLVCVTVLLPVYLVSLGTWSIQTSLPLQLCSLSGILSGIVLLWRNQFAYELLVYWGIPGALYALLTPEMTQGSGTLFLFEYYISHGGILLSVFYLSVVYGMYPGKKSWLKVFMFTQILLFAICILDYYVDANYMYLRYKPQVSNPFILGEWPWYVFGLELAGIIHFYVIYVLFNLAKKNPHS